jgi:hypothetical protein
VEFSNKEFCFDIIVPDNYLVGAIEEDCKCWGRSLVEDYKVNKKDNRSAN